MKNKITKKELTKEFKQLENSMINGVPGVFKIDSGMQGPVLGLTVCTHGNEFPGLAVSYYLRNIFNLNKKLLKGSVIIVLNNIKAANKSLSAKSEKERLKSRFIDLNFNRLPKNLLQIRKDARYEIRRAKELYPVWSMFDVALDIHSTVQDNPPIIIASDNLDYSLVRNFPIKTVVSNIVKIQLGAPAFSFYGGKKKIQTIEIESGQHDKMSSQVIAINCALSLLRELKMINSVIRRNKKKIFNEYYVYGSIIFPNSKCKLNRIYKDFEMIKKGQLLARVDDKNVIASRNSCILMAPKDLRPARIGEEAVFLSKPAVKKIL